MLFEIPIFEGTCYWNSGTFFLTLSFNCICEYQPLLACYYFLASIQLKIWKKIPVGTMMENNAYLGSSVTLIKLYNL